MTAAMISLGDLTRCAADHLAAYTNPAGNYAFASYDHQGYPDLLTPTDCLAPALLQAPVRGRQIELMWREPAGEDAQSKESKPYRTLRQAMQAVLDDEEARSARFFDIDLNSGGAWALVREALVASEDTPGIKASKVTKILHRKRPDLVPVYDRVLALAYGTTTRRPARFWPRYQADLAAHRLWLTDLAAGIQTPDNRALSPIRAADIIVWTHHTTSCPA